MSLTEEQHAERHTGIGGSDAAPALGMSPYKSALELFLDKREQRPGAVSTSAMRWGSLLEPIIRQEYANVTGRIVRVPPGTVRSAAHPFMLAHFDGVTDDGRVFEAKTARTGEGWGAPGSDEVPQHYLLQVQHYLAVTGFKVADIAVLIGGSDFRVFEVPADRELQAMMIEGEAQFWKLVQEGTPPGPDYDAVGMPDLLRRMFPGTNGKTVEASVVEVNYRKTYEHAANAAKIYERVAEGAKAHLLYEMKEAARMTFPDGVQLTRKLVTRKGYAVDPTEFIDSRFSRIKENAA